jgi:Uma2 family endonuclease
MSTAPRYIPHYTIDDYRQWEGDWELIDGVPISMTPSPFGPHERLVGELFLQVSSGIREQGCDCRAYTNLDWILSRDTVVRPDLMIVCGEQPDRHLEHAPVVAVEVLSPSTRERDLTVKQTLYRESGVKHCLVIDPDDRRLTHFTHGVETQIPHDGRVTLELDRDCEIEVDCARLFADR